jgi:hypothetical protein
LGENKKPGASLTFVDGCTGQRLREIEKVSAAWHNAFDAARPVGSVAKAFWSDSWVWKLFFLIAAENHRCDPQVERLLRRVGQLLLDRGVLDPLDEWAIAAENKPESNNEEFTLPGISWDVWSLDFEKLRAKLPWLSVTAADWLFPRNSWPWTISREIAFSWSSQSKYFRQELQRLAASRDKGPVGCLAAAQVLRLWDLADYRSAAADGLKHLSAADFRRDVRALLPPDRDSTKLVYRAADVLRGLDAREIELLVGPLPKQWAALIENFARQLRAQRGKPIAEAVDGVLDEFWKANLRDRTETALREAAP